MGSEMCIRDRLFGFPITDYEDPACTQLPCKLEVGEKATLLFPFTSDSFLKERITSVGVTDTFGRIHKANKKDLKKILSEWKDNFEKET